MQRSAALSPAPAGDDSLDAELRSYFNNFPGYMHALLKRTTLRRRGKLNLHIPVTQRWLMPELPTPQQPVIAELLSYLQHQVLAMPYIWIFERPDPVVEFKPSPLTTRWIVSFHRLDDPVDHRYIRLEYLLPVHN